jgi:hypothetical protein
VRWCQVSTLPIRTPLSDAAQSLYITPVQCFTILSYVSRPRTTPAVYYRSSKFCAVSSASRVSALMVSFQSFCRRARAVTQRFWYSPLHRYTEVRSKSPLKGTNKTHTHEEVTICTKERSRVGDDDLTHEGSQRRTEANLSFYRRWGKANNIYSIEGGYGNAKT